MSDREPFLRAIQEAPDDDTPRLVYADWLEENGDPDRAEFVRVQCDLARRGLDDPRYPELAAREYDLLAAHRKEWSKPLRPYSGNFTFERGFADRMTFAMRKFLDHAPAVFALEPVWHAKLREGQALIGELAGCPHVARLRSLSLNTNQMGPARARVLFTSPHLARLTHLDLGNNGIGTALKELLETPHLGGLRSLMLDNNRVGNKGCELIANAPNAPALRGLTELKLSGSYVGPAGAAALGGAEALAGLADLDLSSNRQLGDAGLEALGRSEVLRGLRRLGLARCGLEAAAFAALGGLPAFANLEELDLSGNHRVTPAGLLAVARTAGLLRLSSLGVCGIVTPSGLPPSRPDAMSLADFTGLLASPLVGRLHRLDLGANRLGCNGAEIIADAPNLANLRELNLSLCHLGDTGAAALAKSARLDRLRVLELRSNQLTDAGAKALAEGPGLGGLRVLDVRFNDRMGNAGREALLGRFGAVVCRFGAEG